MTNFELLCNWWNIEPYSADWYIMFWTQARQQAWCPDWGSGSLEPMDVQFIHSLHFYSLPYWAYSMYILQHSSQALLTCRQPKLIEIFLAADNLGLISLTNCVSSSNRMLTAIIIFKFCRCVTWSNLDSISTLHLVWANQTVYSGFVAIATKARLPTSWECHLKLNFPKIPCIFISAFWRASKSLDWTSW